MSSSLQKRSLTHNAEQLIPWNTCFKTIQSQAPSGLDCQHSTKLASLVFIPEASKYFIG
jgi:hypothetical protein